MQAPKPALLLLSLAAFLTASPGSSAPVRETIPLDGPWSFRQDTVPTNTWKTVQLPASFQSHEGTDFHGIGWYRRAVKVPPVAAGKRLLLHFQAAATEAEVWWNGQPLGRHLGGWTPFRFDVTELVRGAKLDTEHEVLVRLDEKVGHNTQGFLPIIAPHFGGIWQSVSLLVVPETYGDDLQLLAVGEPRTGELRVEFPLRGTSLLGVQGIQLRYRAPEAAAWSTPQTKLALENGVLKLRAPVPNVELWSPASPRLYDVEVRLPGAEGDVLEARAGFRSIEAWGPQFRLNGAPLQIRGLLNWGYAPPRVEPSLDEAVWRAELEFARGLGFNLMKFCLWIPPKRYLELADEMGMLTWMEYPTWHPDFSARHLENLRAEFREFFAYDRNHPSVMLRSLTCETGPSADIEVIRSLYHAAHEMIPGALVEDDSSWIAWNRISDFYDDHPYGNNHTWVKTLNGLKEYILGHGLKPLVLGEAIAADTWIDRERLLKQLGEDRPWWAPGVLDDTGRWLEQMERLAGPGGLADLRELSLRYALLMRKYQVETFLRETPYSGYVVSVIRDIPNASMGLLDYLGDSKWSAADWGWHRDTICLLKTPGDRRGFRSGEPIASELLLSHFGTEEIAGATLEVMLLRAGKEGAPLATLGRKDLQQKPGTLATVAALDWTLPNVEKPEELRLRSSLHTATGVFTNEWPLWVVPAAAQRPPSVQIHTSLPEAVARDLFPEARAFKPDDHTTITVAARFDADLARHLETGGKVLLIPNGTRHSLPRAAHWFLRGAPYIPTDSPLARTAGRQFLADLQHFDLAEEVVPNLPHLDAFQPLLMLWDTHDQKTTVRTHAIVCETRVGDGRLLVTAARHGGADNPAGRWLLEVLLHHLESGPRPGKQLPAPVWEYAKARLQAEVVDLSPRTWRFRPDPKDEGLQLGWHLASLAEESEWSDIKVGAWWESQGHAALDRWAWYRLWIDIPNHWKNREVHLSFEGVDDVYELYVNGQLVGQGGDLAARRDALQERKSHNLTAVVRAGERALVAVRVHDWYGAGGIFRPVSLGTLPFRPELDFLK